MCTVSRDDVRTIITNLLENAIRYSPANGRIEVSATDADGSVEVTIEDRGIGIAAEDLPHIFDRFWRADRARTRSAGGTGLGLTIAKRLADKHRIVLSIESQPGNGTVVVCHIPAAELAQ
jgi:signal transduction histidine kinase